MLSSKSNMTTSVTAHPTRSLLSLARIDIESSIPRNPLQQALGEAPFLQVTGAFNLRDSSSGNSSKLKPGLIFRSGSLGHVTPDGLDALASKYGIRYVLDLRHESERVASPEPIIQGVETLWFPPIKDPMPLQVSLFETNNGENGFIDMFRQILEMYTTSFTRLFEVLKSETGGGILIHCTAGRDRTSVAIALLLALADVPREDIAYDFMLSRIGIEPVREQLRAHLAKAVPEGDVNTLGMRNLATIKEDWAFVLLDLIDVEYGGAGGYFKKLGFHDDDISAVKRYLRQPLAQ